MFLALAFEVNSGFGVRGMTANVPRIGLVRAFEVNSGFGVRGMTANGFAVCAGGGIEGSSFSIYSQAE